MGYSRANQSWLPGATYRLQFNQYFTLKQAASLVDYFHALGITDCYSSPLFMASPGSIHGYDITDYAKINPEIGSEEDLRAFAMLLRQKQMGLILDVVPNHMYIGDLSNPWWLDILENGPSSEYAPYFDIQWKPPKAVLANKVLLPFLAQQYGRALEDQEIKIVHRGDVFFAECYQKKLPIAQRTWSLILSPVLKKVKPELGENSTDVMELESIISALTHLPPLFEKSTEKLKEAKREKQVIKRRLKSLLKFSKEIQLALDRSLTELNGMKSNPLSFDSLDELLSQQAYRLCFWKVATEEINYRRFFDVNELAAIRVEEPEVFSAVHELVFWLLQQGWVTGIRVDHVDGLYDPEQYLKDLQEGCRQACLLQNHNNGTNSTHNEEKQSKPENNSGEFEEKESRMLLPKDPNRPFYIVVEKILSQNEELQPQWCVYGTTGYDFLNLLNGIFIDRESKKAFQDIYAQFADVPQRLNDMVYTCKKLIMYVSMSSEIHALSLLLDRISEQHRWSQDLTLGSLRYALREVIACFSVYRSYFRDAQDGASQESQKHILAAIREAKRRNRPTNETIFDFIRSVLLFEDPEGLSAAQKKERRIFAMRFQQLTGTIMAKGVEDTFFFRSYALASLNEVGAQWGAFGVPLERFHAENQKRLEKWPDTLLASSTHDTKRGEDCRARINVLSEIPQEWKEAVTFWHEMNYSKKKIEEEAQIPSQNEEYLIYQELLGTWPFDGIDSKTSPEYLKRMQRHIKKALREAKVHTTWMNPNEEYEAAVDEFIQKILSLELQNNFVRNFDQFASRVLHAGIFNSLSQTLIKMTVPGIPDFYQGSELWNLSLVDPDNRGVVDYSDRIRYLDQLQKRAVKDKPSLINELKKTIADGKLKLYLISQVLNFRKAHQQLFARGSYVPLQAAGEQQEHLIGYARQLGKKRIIILTSRFFTKLGIDKEGGIDPQHWSDSMMIMPSDWVQTHYRDLFTSLEVIPQLNNEKTVIYASQVFTSLPFCFLESVEE